MLADLFIKVLNLSIGAVPIMAVLLILRLIFKKAVPRKVFYIAWALVFLRLMVPFSLESDLSFFSFMPESSISEENIGTSVVFVKDEGETVEFPVLVRDNPNVDSPVGSEEAEKPSPRPTGTTVSTAPTDKNFVLSTVWVFGTAALLIFGIIGYFAVLKKLKFESVAYTDKIRLSEFFKTPVVCGLFRPKIILPMNFDLDDEAKIHSVIAHETTHIRRGDNFWRLLATFTLYVHWFNPLVWVCYNAFIRDMEVSCDEEVLAKAEKDIRGEYAESLVALAGGGTNPLYGGVLSFGECAIKERVKCIMNFRKTTLLIVILCVAAAAALGVIFLTNPSAGHEPEEISFEITGGENVDFDRENGLSINLKFTNTDEKTIWLSSEITVDRFKDGKGYTERFESPYGTVMVEPGETVVFCDKIPAEYCLEEPVYGEWTIARGISADKEFENSQSGSFTFEVKENKTSSISFTSARIGDIVTFGNYNGALEWLVIGEEGDNLLLITKDCIEALPYNTERKKVTWESCDLRKWLNEDFIEKAFSEEERKIIVSTKLENPDNKRMFGAIGGNSTTDRVFLLSYDEVLECFPNGWNIYTELSPSAEKEADRHEIGGREFWYWWTRSPGLGQDMATIVNGITFGVGDDGLVVSEKHGVRPVVWVNKNWEEQEFVPEPEKENLAPNQPETDKSSDGSDAIPMPVGEEYLIPEAAATTATLFNNTEKTAVESSFEDVLREILKYENFENFMSEETTEESALGVRLTSVDTVEFARVEDGKKYSLDLYEYGFKLRGSAVPEEEQGQIWIVEANKWKEFRHIIADEFENAPKVVPYWFGLINEKNVLEAAVKYGSTTRGISAETDCFSEFIARLRGFGIESPAEHFNGNTLPAAEGEQVTITVEFNTWTKYTILITETELYMVSSDMSYGLKYALPENSLGYDEFTDFVLEVGLQNPMTGKPVIYLYPEKETVVSVDLDFDGKLTYTYPALNDGWKVLAKPDGTLTNLADNSTHYYLFWEGYSNRKWPHEKGFVVKGSETEDFLRKTLAKMGLTPREYNDFITYWVPKMQENPYNLISFSGEEYSEIAKLTVNPKPDSLIRIHMVWMALDAPIEIEPQVIPTYEREGFVLVEWGGTEVFE